MGIIGLSGKALKNVGNLAYGWESDNLDTELLTERIIHSNEQAQLSKRTGRKNQLSRQPRRSSILIAA